MAVINQIVVSQPPIKKGEEEGEVGGGGGGAEAEGEERVQSEFRKKNEQKGEEFCIVFDFQEWPLCRRFWLLLPCFS